MSAPSTHQRLSLRALARMEYAMVMEELPYWRDVIARSGRVMGVKLKRCLSFPAMAVVAIGPGYRQPALPAPHVTFLGVVRFSIFWITKFCRYQRYDFSSRNILIYELKTSNVRIFNCSFHIFYRSDFIF